MNIGVLGAGAWGTALAQLAASNGHAVTLWAREADVVHSINTAHINTTYLPDTVLSERITATDDMSALGTAEIILAVPPAQFMRATLNPEHPLCCAQKALNKARSN